ncbi:hypothetical protein [Mesorhizobium sp. WSM3859]|uniref:hypothetical protein n=1 Tax=Mesorhizobium sp. WSM3859 TaxID=2029402 RepID=UPI001140E256|nr:hypothetical protein [Mesorhizobium sp. WSM3859]
MFLDDSSARLEAFGTSTEKPVSARPNDSPRDRNSASRLDAQTIREPKRSREIFRWFFVGFVAWDWQSTAWKQAGISCAWIPLLGHHHLCSPDVIEVAQESLSPINRVVRVGILFVPYPH